MSSPTVLTSKLTEFSEYLDNLSQLDTDSVKQCRDEIKRKGRNFIKFQAEVKMLNDDDLITKFSQLMKQFKNVRARANGQEIEEEKKTEVSNISHNIYFESISIDKKQYKLSHRNQTMKLPLINKPNHHRKHHHVQWVKTVPPMIPNIFMILFILTIPNQMK